jgi:RNA polymerase sigma-70 factor (ECF subfamily)
LLPTIVHCADGEIPVDVSFMSSGQLVEQAAVTAIASGDANAFAALAEPYRPRLQVHCYRMLGSFDDAEDAVQETLLRAWRSRGTFQGRSLFRTWLYRIATNTCLNALERGPAKRVLPQDVAEPVTATTDSSRARSSPDWAPEVPWLQPFPDTRLDVLSASDDTEPETATVRRETIELTFLAALQHLPPRQRAILILRDVLEFSAIETAGMVEASVASVNSAHQRARATMRSRLGPTPPDAAAVTSSEERAALADFMAAWEQADTQRMTSMLREDARWAMPPAPLWFDGRDAIVRLYTLYPIDLGGRSFHMLPAAANRQPAAAAYVRAPGEEHYTFTALHVLRVVDVEGEGEGEGGGRGQIAEVTTFGPELCAAFAFADTL